MTSMKKNSIPGVLLLVKIPSWCDGTDVHSIVTMNAYALIVPEEINAIG
jgi:hypothetical protein